MTPYGHTEPFPDDDPVMAYFDNNAGTVRAEDAAPMADAITHALAVDPTPEVDGILWNTDSLQGVAAFLRRGEFRIH